MKHYSLRTMISIGFALIVLAVVFLISIASNILISRQFEKYVLEQQDKKAEEMAQNLVFQYDNAAGEWNLDYIHGLGMYALNEGYIIKLYDADENILWDAENHDMTLCHQMMDTISLRMKENRPGLDGDFVIHRFILNQEDQIIGILDVSHYSPYYLNEDDFRFLSALNRILFAVGIISLTGAVLAGLLLANSISRPIARTVEVTKEISEGNYHADFQKKVRTKELLELTQSVDQMAAALEEQENLQKRLTSDVAHELRTPLANVSSWLEAILEGVWEPTQERLQSCYEELNRLTGLVSDLERLRQAENENLKLQKEETDLFKLAQSVIDCFEAQLTEKRLCCTAEGVHAAACVDPNRMKQVISNLLSNAVKYSNEGGSVRCVIDRTKDAVILRVEDDGIGIAEKDLERIFERFYRADRSRSRRTGGAGIGLTIVKTIVQAHGGRVTAESREGHGSCFTITLPEK